MADRSFAEHSLLIGLCALIPLPFVDGIAARRLRRRFYAHVAARAGHVMDEATLESLTRSRDSLMMGCLVGAVVYPIRKLFRTILYFLSLKQAVDWSTDTVHRGRMLELALRRGLLPVRAEAVRTAMDAAMGSCSTSPLNRVVLRKPTPAVPDFGDHEEWSTALTWLHATGGGRLVMSAFERELERIAREPRGPAQVPTV